MQIQIFGDTVQERLKHWRQEVLRISQAELCDRVNGHLPKSHQVSVSTISNYERSTEPRASFLAALTKTYPELNLDWVVSGNGKVLTHDRQVGQLLEELQGENGKSALDRLVQQPGLQRFRKLPEPAAHVVLAFLEEVRLSNPEYQGEHSRPWREFLQRFATIFFDPIESPKHLAPAETLSTQEITTYALAVVAALRPLVPSFRAPSHQR